MRNAKKLLMISLTVGISGCSCLQEFEKNHKLYEIDVKNNVCGEYKIISVRDDKYQWERDLPLSSCDGYFSLSPEGFNAARRCAKKTIDNCKTIAVDQ